MALPPRENRLHCHIAFQMRVAEMGSTRNQCSRIARTIIVASKLKPVALKISFPDASARCVMQTAQIVEAVTEKGKSRFIGAWRKKLRMCAR